MRKWCVGLLTSCLLLELHAQVAELLPDPDDVPQVDMITPVPAPEIPFDAPLASAEQMVPEDLKIENGGGTIEGGIETGVRLGGPIRIEGDNGLEIFSNSAELDLKAKTVTLLGDVSVYQGNLMQRGDKAVYHYERKFLDTRGMRSSVDPFLLEAGRFTAEEVNGRQTFVGYDAGVTTDDHENPDYWIRSEKTRIYPGEKIVFHDLRLFAGERQVLWLPYLNQSLDSNLGYHFLPGARSNWGPFLLNRYGVMLGGERDPHTGENENAWLLSTWHMDIRGRRGLGLGLDLQDTRLDDPSGEITGLSLYYLNDLDPSAQRSGVPRGFVNEDRYKVGLQHRIVPDFPDHADWRFDANLTWLSDQHYLEDFDPGTYRSNPAPDNTLGLYRRDETSLLSLFTRLRVNDFYRADTRLPEIAYDQSSRPIFGLPVLHQGSTSFGILGERAPDVTRNAIVNPLMTLDANDPETARLLRQLSGYERRVASRLVSLPVGDPRREALRSQLVDSGYNRFNTWQGLSMPTTLGGFLTLTPQLGFGYSDYSAVEGPQDRFNRTHLHAGAEASVKFSKDLGRIRNHDLGLDGLLHVVQPYGAWSLVSTDDFDSLDPRIDRLTPTTRPRPIDPDLFTAIDEMRSWNIFRMGTRNRYLTHRDGQSFEWLYLDSYLDAFLDDPEGDRQFSNLYNDVRWTPLPWLGVELLTQFPVLQNGSGFSEVATRLHIMPNDRFEFVIGQRRLDGHPILTDSNQFDLETYTRLNDDWGIGTRHIMELDDSTLELQQYTIHRSLGSWTASVGLSARDNRLEEEYGVVFGLSLSEFPSVSLPFEISAE